MDKVLRVCVSLLILHTLIGLSASQAPSLNQHLSNYTVNPSLQPYFPFCSFSGNPTPSITWSYNGERLPSDSSQAGPYYVQGSGVLVLTGASSGTYTCTGTNEFGSDAVTIVITIRESQSAPWYIMPYMWFVYAVIIWMICLILIVILFFYKKKRAEHDLPAADPWLGN